MCFIIHEKHKEPKIATKDIVCYKTGTTYGERFTSYFQDFKYTKDVTQRAVKLVIKSNYRIDKGYHSFRVKKTTLEKTGWFIKGGKFIIPKGSKYYYNPDKQEYVSNKIIFKGWITK